MPKHKVTATECLDGKRHSWRFQTNVIDNNELYWCRKCGCLTEFIRGTSKNKWRKTRCRDHDSKGRDVGYYVEIPAHLK